ncbi:hypothetical protein [Salmonirosea aquatica]|uniref:Uncharacterized protein n=1 Tax=Salmonirosea aquatica TaxID=2654236 RepID=A0A7C9FBE6_9BACT|nr:hypothetical protein [Cytophagaceae bacterium SJW1-29]
MNYTTMEVFAGTSFEKAAAKAKGLAAQTNGTVEFRFNGVTVRVLDDTDLDHLHRDYNNQSYLGWKIVGPRPMPAYPPSLQRKLDKAKLDRQKIREQEYAEYLARTYL